MVLRLLGIKLDLQVVDEIVVAESNRYAGLGLISILGLLHFVP